MSKVVITGNASGTGDFTIAAPNSNTNRTLTLPDETGTVLTTASTSVVTPAMLTQPLTAGTAVATTSGTAIDFTGIPSWVKRITLLFNAVSTVGGSAYKVQIGSGSFSTSGYAGSTVYAGASTGGTTNTTGFIMWRGGAGEAQSGSFIIHLIEGTTYIGSGVFGYTSAQNYTSMGGGSSPALSGTLDRIRLTTISGTEAFDAGSINIMYEG